MNGLARLSYGTIADWARLTGSRPTAEDVDALMMLDGVMMHPGDEE